MKPFKVGITCHFPLGMVMLNLEPPIAILRKTTNYSPPNYTCTDASGCPEVQGDCNAEF